MKSPMLPERREFLSGVAALGLFIVAFPMVVFSGVDGAAVSRSLVQIGVCIATLYFARRLISRNTVNWINQAKVSLIIVIFAGAILSDQQPLHLRFLGFGLANLILIFWLHDEHGRLF